MKKLIPILFFLFPLNVFAYSGYPKDYSSFKCLASTVGIVSEYNIHSCDYKKNTCLIALHDELDIEAYAELWDVNNSRLTILMHFYNSLRILTIYPDYGEPDFMPLSLIWQNVDPPVRHQLDENFILGGAKQFIGNCMPIK